jgi:hypothetical protein
MKTGRDLQTNEDPAALAWAIVDLFAFTEVPLMLDVLARVVADVIASAGDDAGRRRDAAAFYDNLAAELAMRGQSNG